MLAIKLIELKSNKGRISWKTYNGAKIELQDTRPDYAIIILLERN